MSSLKEGAMWHNYTLTIPSPLLGNGYACSDGRIVGRGVFCVVCAKDT
jgi:hypothetical protein